MSQDESDDEPNRKQVVFDFAEAKKIAVAAGFPENAAFHILYQAMEISLEVVGAYDAVVKRLLVEGKCLHPEAVSVSVAILASRHMPMRIRDSGYEPLDAAKCLEIANQISEVDDIEDEAEVSEDDTGTPSPLPTVH